MSAPVVKDEKMDHILIFGTGDFAQALGWRLNQVGYKITFVSRDPEASRKKMFEKFVDIITAQDTISLPKGIIILAIPETVDTSPLQPLFQERIVIDVRNKMRLKRSQRHLSLGQNLQETHPKALVVKSFNSLSAYALRQGIFQSGNQASICGNDSDAKDKVARVVRSLGLTPVDIGDIGQAAELENRQHAFFGEWKAAMIITAIVMSFFWLVLVFRWILCPNFEAEEWNFDAFKEIILTIAMLTFGLTALIDLALCYTPGVIAAYIQLFRGTKYSLFPNWLDIWLKSRKQLGLIAAQLALTHWIGAVVHIIPIYGRVNFDGWRNEAYLITGIFGYCLMLILCAVSLPSVASSLSWKEFSFLQRYLGWWSLIFSTFHMVFLAWDSLIKNQFECYFIPEQMQIAVVIPALTILFKLPLLLPFVDSRLKRIRRGVDAKSSKKEGTAYYNIEAGSANVAFQSD